MLTVRFWRLALERAVKTAAQFALGLFVADTTGVVTLDWSRWSAMASAALTGALFSILTSIATAGMGPYDDPSAV